MESDDTAANRQPPTAHLKAMELARRMLKMVESGTTDQADEIREVAANEYLDSTRYQAECETLFRLRPVFAGFSCEVAASGQYKTLDLPGFPVIIVRGTDSRLRAFLNACRHRGSRLVNLAGRTQRFICPYHGWSYELNGVLHPRTVAQTHFSDHATFDTYGPNQLTGFTGRQIGRLAETLEAEWEPLRHLQFIYFLFPNTVLTVMRDHTEYFQTLPGANIGEAFTNYVYFTYPGTRFSSAEVADERFAREHAILIEEDCPMAESMQRTLTSGALRSVLFGRNEPGLQHFHRSIEEILDSDSSAKRVQAW